jgi:hypothetical protein
MRGKLCGSAALVSKTNQQKNLLFGICMSNLLISGHFKSPAEALGLMSWTDIWRA